MENKFLCLKNQCVSGNATPEQIKISDKSHWKERIEMPDWDFNNPESMKAWDLASGSYAEQVSGEVRAVVGSTLRKGIILENAE